MKLLMVRLNVYEKWCIILVDYGYSCTVVVKKICRSQQKLNIIVSTVGSGMQTCRVEPISLCSKSKQDVGIEAVVVPDDPFEFDLLQGIDVSKALGGGVYFKVVKGTISLSLFLFVLQHQHSLLKNLIFTQSSISIKMHGLYCEYRLEAKHPAICRTALQNIPCQGRSERSMKRQ